MTASVIASKLPEYAVNQLVQMRGETDAHWKLCARLLERLFDDAKVSLPKMLIYQNAAAYVGQRTSTVRNWLSIYQTVGDDLLDEYAPVFTYSHWRAMVPAAKRVGKSIADYAAELAATADDYGGMPIPPDVIVARSISGPKTDAELFDDALHSAWAAFAIISNHVGKVRPELADDVTVLIAQLQRFTGKVEKAK